MFDLHYTITAMYTHSISICFLQIIYYLFFLSEWFFLFHLQKTEKNQKANSELQA